MDLHHARQGHASWRSQLERATGPGGERPDTATTADAGRCDFGAWLNGPGQQRFGERAAWRQCVQRHAEFHRAAGSVAAAINRGDSAAARAMLAAGTPFTGAERALLAAIDALMAEARPTPGESASAAAPAQPTRTVPRQHTPA